ncbi:MAG: Flp family type IVb pilin [Sphingomonadales bacterium]|nr:Flp family type IVb pilin [Sphingomonadales bacterium]
MTKLFRLFRSETAATAIEYGLIVAIIAVGCLTAFQNLATQNQGQWNEIETAATDSRN